MRPKVHCVSITGNTESLATSHKLNSHYLVPGTSFYQVDLSDPSAIASIADRVRKEHGDPTVLVNNAGIGNAMSLLDLPEPKIRKVFEVNIIAHILLIKEFLPSMVQRNHGHIVNIASMASFSTQASNVDYGCSKAAVLSFSEGLAQELRHIYKAPMVRTR
jgi:all-trans-retinol dehydrogenase (NAD+)